MKLWWDGLTVALMKGKRKLRGGKWSLQEEGGWTLVSAMSVVVVIDCDQFKHEKKLLGLICEHA